MEFILHTETYWPELQNQKNLFSHFRKTKKRSKKMKKFTNEVINFMY